MTRKKTKCLVLCSRGVNHQDRHLMLDIREMLPHSKKDCKFDKKDSLTALNELASLSSADKCLYFENRKGKLLLLWASNVDGGPSVKFLVTGVHTMADIKLIGNCLKGSRPILSFDHQFDKIPHLQLIKELFIQIFNVPYKHTKSQPFLDHVVTFSYLDGHIWFRHYQILDQKEKTLAEIGPRMILMPMLILSSSYCGKVIWANYKKASKKDSVTENKKKKAKKDSRESEDANQATDDEYQSDSDDYEDIESLSGDVGSEQSDDDLDDIEKYKS